MARNAGDPAQPVPGVVVEHRLRDAGTGNNWQGRDRSGVSVVVRMLRLPVDGKARDRALLEARELIGISHPHLVSVRDAAPTVDGIAVVRDAVPGAMSLARLQARRAVLAPGEVITIGVPMFQALAAVHDAGHTHGRVRPEDILIDPAGRPMLTGAGISGVLGAAGLAESDVGELAALLLSAMGPPAPPGEGPVPQPAGAVAAALAPAVSDDASLRPPAARIAVALGRCGPPAALATRAGGADGRAGKPPGGPGEPGSTGSGWPAPPGGPGESGEPGSDWPGELGSTGSGWPAGPGEPGSTGSGWPAPAEGAGRSSNPARRLGAGALPLAVDAASRLRRLTGTQALAAAVLGLAAVALTAWLVLPGGSGGAQGARAVVPPGTAAPPSGEAEDTSARTGPGGAPADGPADGPAADATEWRTVLSRLDLVRAQAFTRGDRDQLAEADVADSPAHLEDLKAFDAMRARSAYAQALSPRIQGLVVVSAESTRAVLRVTDTLPPYRFVDAGGRVLKRVPGRGRVVYDVTLVHSPAGWRVLVVDAAGGT
jgi:hypothetical protein